MFKLKKEKFSAIDGAFLVLKENPNSASALQIIEENLNDCFMCDFKVNIVSPSESDKLFVMSVFPEISTTDKIIAAILSNKPTDAIEKLWKTNKKWTIEIDKKLFDDGFINLTNKELTAILLHEVGHVVSSNSIPTRISIVLRYEIAKAKTQNKFIMKDRLFAKIMSLPILDACISDEKRDKSSIREEVKADKFAKQMGYSNELSSVLSKLMNNKYYPNVNTIDEKITKSADMANNIIDELRLRQNVLAKKNLGAIKESVDSEYVRKLIDDTMDQFFNAGINFCEDAKDEFITEYINDLIEKGIVDTFCEGIIFGPKKLKRIDPMEIDYISVKLNEIKSQTDKMMLITYIHSKIDIVEYYISLLEDPKLSKKYAIPHSLPQLYDMKKRLEALRLETLKYKIPEYKKDFLVKWPDNYYG